MNKRYFAAIVIIVMVAGGLYAMYTWNSAPHPPGPTPETVMQEIRQEFNAATRESAAAMAAVKKEVKGIRGKITAEVGAMPPDDIARGLNDELARFRELESSADRVDSTKTGVLGRN